jgi:hypothetical protein
MICIVTVVEVTVVRVKCFNTEGNKGKWGGLAD